MHVLPQHRRILVLTEGRLGALTAKTAAALLRYRAADIVALVDSAAAGVELARVMPWAAAVPVLPTVAAADALAPDALYIGVSPPGGALPPALRDHIAAALQRGLDLVSGLHAFLADDPAFAQLAAQYGGRIFDVRRPPAIERLATGRARSTRCRRILTVGTDGNVGKMVTSLELTAAARGRGRRATFLATGQTGIMIAGRGVAVDAIATDFAPTAVEDLVLSAAEDDICFIEGQGSIAHPGFSVATLALLHGACPDALVLVHHAGRTRHRVPPHAPLPPLRELCATYEAVASLLQPTRIAGVALNPFGQDPATVARDQRWIERELGLPVANAVGPGAARLLDALEA